MAGVWSPRNAHTIVMFSLEVGVFVDRLGTCGDAAALVGLDVYVL